MRFLSLFRRILGRSAVCVRASKTHSISKVLFPAYVITVTFNVGAWLLTLLGLAYVPGIYEANANIAPVIANPVVMIGVKAGMYLLLWALIIRFKSCPAPVRLAVIAFLAVNAVLDFANDFSMVALNGPGVWVFPWVNF